MFCIRAVGLEHRVRRDEQQGGAAGAAICEIQNNKGFVGKGLVLLREACPLKRDEFSPPVPILSLMMVSAPHLDVL